MGPLWLEPRKKEADPKRQEAGADRQVYLKGVRSYADGTE